MAKLKTLLLTSLLTILFLSGIGKAGLTLTNSISDITTRITTKFGSPIETHYGPLSRYENLESEGVSIYLHAQSSIQTTDDYIRNMFTSNQYFWSNYQPRYTYNSAITFQATDNGTGTQAIIVTTGDLYLNGSKLEREIDGSYIVPTAQDLIATWNYSYNTIYSSNANVAIKETCPLTTANQDIYLQGYVMAPVPEPATMAMLSFGSLLSFWRKKRRIA